MSKLREDVKITTASGKLEGHLYVGVDGLPELIVYHSVTREQLADGIVSKTEDFRPATFPAAWTLRTTGEIGVLLIAWWAIQGIQEELRKAEREADDVDA